jgi:hypothetical protein
MTSARAVTIPQEIVALAERKLTSKRQDPMITIIGISDNTWRKVRAGEPIRKSLALRLIERMQAEASTGERPHP